MQPAAKILIADSGATKTRWCLSGKDMPSEQFMTVGVNPFFRTTDDIVEEWVKSPLSRLREEVKQVIFYGAGIVSPEKAELVRKALVRFFPEAETGVFSDLLAAARATLGTKSGIACILGTGSNSCRYNGEEITDHVPPLGFILGDEGSGSYLGRQLVGDYLKKLMPGDLAEKFQKKYPIPYTEFLNEVYHGERPSRFLAGFVPFLKENISDTYCVRLIGDAFERFIERNVAQYPDYRSQPVCFVGSVAFYFQEQLVNVLQEKGLIPGVILKDPLEKLTAYHLQYSIK